MLGKLFIVAAPSGAGKTSLLKKALSGMEHIGVSVSHTTRPPRAGERDGEDYHFVKREVFAHMIERGDFLEHAKVFGHDYGTARDEVDNKLARGESMVLEIDCQGAQQVRRNHADTFSIFILPPSMAALRERLEKRDTDSPETIQHRLDIAQQEIHRHKEFDALVVNDDFDTACTQLKRLLAGLPAAGRASAKHTLHTLLAAKTHPDQPDADGV